MEPIATAFATIVGLLAAFKGESRAKADDEYNDFIAWLSEHKHTQVVDLLEINASAVISVKALLKQDREVILQRLDEVDKMLAIIASQVNGISDLAKAIRPNAEISDQALSILAQMESAGAHLFMVVTPFNENIELIMSGGRGGNIRIEMPRFLEDDLNILVTFNFLILDYNNVGDRLYRITRQGAKLVQLSLGSE